MYLMASYTCCMFVSVEQEETALFLCCSVELLNNKALGYTPPTVQLILLKMDQILWKKISFLTDSEVNYCQPGYPDCELGAPGEVLSVCTTGVLDHLDEEEEAYRPGERSRCRVRTGAGRLGNVTVHGFKIRSEKTEEDVRKDRKTERQTWTSCCWTSK